MHHAILLNRRATLKTGLLGAASLLSARAALPARQTSAATQPDIILLITDDMRESDWDMLPQATNLVGGTRFANFRYSTPQCGPTRATFFTGQYAHNTRVRSNSDGWPQLRGRTSGTLFTALQGAGYRTALVGKFINGYKGSAVAGLDRTDFALAGQPRYTIRGEYSTTLFQDNAVSVISDHLANQASDPLFLCVGFNAPHNPATPRPGDQNIPVDPVVNGLDRRRRQTLIAVDDAVAAIANALGSRWNDAVVALVSDHGYLFKKDGHGKIAGKGNWYREITRVPALIRAPGLSGGDDSRLAASIDLAPTLLAAAGILDDPQLVDWVIDGRPLQESWDRQGILLDGRSSGKSDKANIYFDAVAGGPPDQDYTLVRIRAHSRKSSGKGKKKTDKFGLYTDLAQKRNRWQRLPKSERTAWTQYLNRFVRCRGETCRQAEDTAPPASVAP